MLIAKIFESQIIKKSLGARKPKLPIKQLLSAEITKKI
jgi:hypothetical protein